MNRYDLRAAVDISGNQKVGNYRYLGWLVVTDDLVKKIMNEVDNYTKQIRMTDFQKLQRYVLPRINFDDRDILAFCIEIDRDPILTRLSNMSRIKHKHISRKKIIRTYNNILFHKIREPTLNFLAAHGKSFSDVAFECDSDCRDFLKQNGLRYADAGQVHHLADLIAFANNRGWEPRGVRHADLREYINKELLKYW